MSSSALDSKTILLVENEPLVRMFMVDLLQEEGYRALEAAHADEALTLLRARPDVLAVVTDVNMPGMSGFELARAIREKNPMMSVVIMSAVTGPGEEGLPDNAVFLAKPTMPEMIIDAVNRAVIGTLTARTNLSGPQPAPPDSNASGEHPPLGSFDPPPGNAPLIRRVSVESQCAAGMGRAASGSCNSSHRNARRMTHSLQPAIIGVESLTLVVQVQVVGVEQPGLLQGTQVEEREMLAFELKQAIPPQVLERAVDVNHTLPERVA